jgi:hypothetical protein
MAPGTEAPPPEGGDELRKEHSGEPSRVVGTPHAVAAQDALLSLTRAARSFTLYEPSNKVVRTLIGDYRDKFRHVLDTHGPLALDVHAFELLLEGQVVYVEKDRERSLAFRLFRDGVRQLTFDPATTWEELLRLLEILSIRYTGVRQQEDDLVTLLRKASFAHVAMTAIEGFVPEEEQTESAPGRRTRDDASRYDPPRGWDPPAALGEARPLRHRTVPDELRQRLQAEEAPGTVATHAVRATLELLAAAGPDERDAAQAFALEVREFLLVEGRTDLVIELARAGAGALARQPEIMRAFLALLLDPRTLRAVIEGLPPEATRAPPHLAEVLAAAPDAFSAPLLELLLAEGEGPRAPLLRGLVAGGARLSPAAIAERLPSAQGAARARLMRLLSEVDPAAALRDAQAASAQEDPEVQMEALRQLQAAEFGPDVARALRRLVESPVESVRVATLPVMARGGPRVAPALAAHAEKHADSLSRAEAEATGRALAQASPRSALDHFQGWLQSRGGGLLGRLSRGLGPAALQQAALAGLESIGGGEADALLELLTSKGEPEVATAARRLTERRRAAGGTS